MQKQKFKDKSKKNKPSKPTEQMQEPGVLEGPIRVKLPRQNEVIGIIEQRLGGNRMLVNCLDKVSRNCRVPGKLKRKLWLRADDVVIVQPWEFDNSKGDVVFKYNPTAIQWLKTRGYLKTEDSEF